MIGVVCGFDAEIACFERIAKRLNLAQQDYAITPSGSSSARAREAADQLIQQGATKLVSFGIGGSLSPRLRVGDVVFSNHVVTTLDESYGTRPQRQKVSELQTSAVWKPIMTSVCGVDEIVFTPDEKKRLHQLTRAELADMESHSVARAATLHKRPFYTLRAVSDGIDDTLPRYVANGVDPAGKPQLIPILKGLLMNPGSLGQLLALQKNTNKAIASLEEAGVRLLPKIME